MNHQEFPNQKTSLIQFDLQKDHVSIIKVIGVGGGGSNAVNHMFRQGIKGVDFLVCNTDAQALEISPVPLKMQLGPGLTKGRGAGAIPEVGKNAAIENENEIRALLGDGTRMVFITAGMGGGTGTGAAPIIAGIAKEMGVLTVGIVTVPFGFEGRKRKQQAEAGIEEMKNNVDALLIICNDKLREIHGNLQLSRAFGHADDVLAVAAKSIAEIITNTMHLNVDFADIETVMKNSGVAIMGSATAEGDNRAVRAAEAALDSPLLNDNVIEGANYILLSITSGSTEATMDEVGEINDYIQAQAGQTAEIILGLGHDAQLGDKVAVTVIATGFKTGEQKQAEVRRPDVVVYKLEETTTAPVTMAAQDVKPDIKDEFTEVNPLEPVLIIRELETRDDIPDFESQVDSEFMDASLDLESRMIEFEFPEEEKEPVIKLTHPEPVHQTPVAASDTNNIIKHDLYNENNNKQSNTPVQNSGTQQEMTQEDDMYQRSRERIYRLKEISMRLNSPSGIADMEKEPAYKRRNVKFDNTPASADSSVSRYTLSMDETQNKPELRPNNPFLHDRVD